jgi:hypothetical protein
MFWNKKDSKGRLPDLPEERINMTPISYKEPFEEKHTLPSFPDSMSQKGFSQSAIKEAINEEEIPEIEETSTKEMEEWSPSINDYEEPIPQSVEEYVEEKNYLQEPPKEAVLQESKKLAKAEIFVKIEKYKAVRKNLQEISTKINDIEEMLKRIRDIKMREEQELSSWEKDMIAAKSRIKEVTENIFEKLE